MFRFTGPLAGLVDSAEPDEYYDTMGIDNIIGALTLAVLAIGILLAARQLGLLKSQMMRQYEWSAKLQALSYSMAQNTNLRDARMHLDLTFGNLLALTEPIPASRIREAIEADKSVLTDLRYLLAHWGNLALAIKSGVCDEEVAREMVGVTLTMHVRALRGYIEERRQTHPSFYEYLLDLSQRWETAIERNERPAWKDFKTQG